MILDKSWIPKDNELNLDVSNLPEPTVLRFEIEGIKPLLMNPFRPDDKDFSKKEQSGNLSPKQCAEHRLIMKNNKIGIPNTYIHRMMEQSSTNFTLEGKGKKTYKDIIRGYVSIEPEFIELKNAKWVTNSRGVVIKATKGRIMRHRPEVIEYKAVFDAVIKDPLVNIQKIVNIVQYGGDRIGVGDDRPKYGLFKVTQVKKV